MPELFHQDYPGPTGATPLLVLHGLFGSSSNWRGIARRLSAARRVLVLDLRNHGHSFHDQDMSYRSLAGDVLDTLDRAGLEHADLLGHSMGGKTAMVAGVESPQRIGRLVIVDIAPVVYVHADTHCSLIDAMQNLQVAKLRSRNEADEKLRGEIPDRMTRQFLLQSLEPVERGYRWRLNLAALKRAMDDLVGFPDLGDRTFNGPALFAYGTDSEYLLPEYRPRIQHYFPGAEYAAIEHAGHWVHVAQPDTLAERISEFLDD